MTAFWPPSEVSAPGNENRQRRPTLYRYFDAEGRLLYVGVTTGHMERMLQHSLAALWWTDAMSCTLVHFTDEDAMHAAEREAITTERPLYNRIFSVDWNSPEERAKRAAMRRAWRKREDARYRLRHNWSALMHIAAAGAPIE